MGANKVNWRQPTFWNKSPGVDLGKRNTSMLEQEMKKGETYTFLALSRLPAVAAQSFPVSVRRKVDNWIQIGGPWYQGTSWSKMQKKKKVRQKANVTYLPLHAFLPGFCSSWRRGISRVLGMRVTAVGGRGKQPGTANQEITNILATLSCTFTHTPTQTWTVPRPVEAGEQCRSKRGP